MKPFLLAIQFLTIIPVRVTGDVTDRMIGRSIGAFPLAGVVQGIFIGLAAPVLLVFFPSGLTAGLLVLILVITNGGFHLDGLSDTLDALSIKSSGDETADREKRLMVMKDSTTGPIGAVGIVLVLLLKCLGIMAVIDIAANDSGLIFMVLFLMPVFGKWSTVSAIVKASAAQANGLGKLLIDNSGWRELVGATLWTAGVAGLLFFLFAPYPSPDLPLFFSIAFTVIMTVLYLLAKIIKKIGDKKIGGLTGDLLGALNEIAEITYILIVTACLQLSI